MNLTKAELRKQIYDFNSISNRLLQADYVDYNGVLRRFVSYVKYTPIISDYVLACGECDLDVANEVEEVSKSYGRAIFALGDTDEEEGRNIIAILDYIQTNEVQVYLGIAESYSSSHNFNEMMKDFNNRVVRILINHISDYLVKLGIDMGLDESVTYSIVGGNGQVIIANDSSVVTATNNQGIDLSELSRIISKIKDESNSLSKDDSETVNNSLTTISDEVKTGNPRKPFIKTAIAALKGIKGSTEFFASVAALIQFFQPLL